LQARPLPLAAFAAAALSPVALIGLGAAFGGLWLWTAFLAVWAEAELKKLTSNRKSQN